MTALLILIGLFILFLIFAAKDVAGEDEIWSGCMAALLIIILIFTIVNVIVYSNTLGKVNERIIIQEKVKIAEQQERDLTEAIKIEATKYVQYEESVFNNIKPANVQLLLSYYPQLRSVEAIAESIKAIKMYGERKYDFLLCEQDLTAMINTYKASFLTFIPVD